MTSFVWSREPEEAYCNPYEYDAQKQFSEEASRVLAWLEERVNPRERRYTVDERSLAKALWMLRTDTVDNFCEALTLVDERRHRPAGRLFRDALEGMDLAFALGSDPAFVSKWLSRWYANKSPSHGTVRRWMETFKSKECAESRSEYYDQLSKYAHRTYRALLKSYSVGAESMLVHDRWSPNTSLVLPHTIAAYYAILADLIQLFVEQLVENGALSSGDAAQMWGDCLDEHTVPRRFLVQLDPLGGNSAS